MDDAPLPTGRGVATIDRMLELRPNCEHCAVDLPPASTEAMICTYECTFCRTCVDEVLHDVCPNCAGGFQPRPIRPATAWVEGVGVTHQPPTTERRHRPVDPERHRALVARVAARPGADR